MIKCRKWRLLSRFLKLSAFGVKPGHPSEKRQARPIHRPYCPLFTAPTTWLRRFAGGERAEADGESVRHLAELGFQNSGEEEEANWCGARVRESESSQRSAECFGRNNESRNGSHGRVIPEGNGGSLRGWQHFPLAPRGPRCWPKRVEVRQDLRGPALQGGAGGAGLHEACSRLAFFFCPNAQHSRTMLHHV